MSEVSKEIAVVPSNIPAKFEAANLIKMYEEVKAEVMQQVTDIETVEGRKHITSLAKKINASKKAIDEPLRNYLRDIKAIPKVIEKNARESLERFTELHEEFTKPYNLAIKPQNDQIALMGEIVAIASSGNESLESLRKMLTEAGKAKYEAETFYWPELKKKANTAIDFAISTLEGVIEKKIKEEEMLAEIERLRKEKEEADRVEELRKVAEAAAQEAIAREREATERRILDERNKQEASRLAELKAIEDGKLAQAEAIRKIEEAKNRIIEEQEKAQAKIKAAIEKTKAETEERIKREAIKLEDEAQKRAEDKQHRAKINRAALVALMTIEGISEELGKQVVTLINKGGVPNVKISY